MPRNVEEIQGTINQLEKLAQNLEAAKDEAMVRGGGCWGIHVACVVL